MEKEITPGLVGILILFYNKVDQTIDCIRSFLPSAQNIYVLNNGSDATQFLKLKNTFAGNTLVHIIGNGENLGVSGGRNYLIKHTSEEWLLSVDNDITISPTDTWLLFFMDLLRKNPDAQIICPHIYNVHENAYALQLQIQMKGNEVSVETGLFATTNCFPGGASIIHRGIFETYGLFDEEMFVGFEDYEFAIRAMLSEQGELKAYHINEIELIHDHQFQKSSSDKEAVIQRYNEEKIKASYEHLVSKYKIVFEHDWQWWTRKQVQDMTEKRWLPAIKTAIKKLFGR